MMTRPSSSFRGRIDVKPAFSALAPSAAIVEADADETRYRGD